MKTAIVTGASGGIGAETAIQLARDGYSVAVIFNNGEEKANTVVKSINSFGKAKAFKCDIKDSAQVNFTVDLIEKELGCVSVLINNAGIAQQKLFTDITDIDWHNMIETDLSGAFYFCRAVLPYMINRKSGKIINIASMWGETGGSCEVHYSAAKSGVIGLTKALAKEVSLSGITVNCVSPGVIKTDMVTRLGQETMNLLKEEIPLNRLGTPNDIANAVSFLASDKASYITGQVLSVNGGIII